MTGIFAKYILSIIENPWCLVGQGFTCMDHAAERSTIHTLVSLKMLQRKKTQPDGDVIRVY